jgi:hypothetical protein
VELAALIGGVLASASLATEVCEDPCMLVTVHSDGTYSMQSASGDGRSTPVIDATIVGVLGQDIDGDGTPERVVVDDRESAFGSVTAVYFDVSIGEPYLAFQCQASIADAVETECLEWYQSLTAQRAIEGADIIYSSTRQDGELDWETRNLAIPNWTSSIALTIANLNVDLHREQHANSGSAETLASLKAALDLRELRALQFSIAD